MLPSMNFDRSESEDRRSALDVIPEWLAVPAPVDAPQEDAPDVALGLAISVVSSLIFWAGLAALLLIKLG